MGNKRRTRTILIIVIILLLLLALLLCRGCSGLDDLLSTGADPEAGSTTEPVEDEDADTVGLVGRWNGALSVIGEISISESRKKIS